MALKEQIATELARYFEVESDQPDRVAVISGAEWLERQIEAAVEIAIERAMRGEPGRLEDPWELAAEGAEEFNGMWAMIQAPILAGIAAALTPEALRAIAAEVQPDTSGRDITTGLLLGAPLGYRLGKAMRR